MADKDEGLPILLRTVSRAMASSPCSASPLVLELTLSRDVVTPARRSIASFALGGEGSPIEVESSCEVGVVVCFRRGATRSIAVGCDEECARGRPEMEADSISRR